MNRRQPTRDIAEPREGLFSIRLCRGGPPVAASITRRLGMLTATVNGQPASVEHVWESGSHVTEAEWLRLDANRPADPATPVDFRALRVF
jgi:hypothetical protein